MANRGTRNITDQSTISPEQQQSIENAFFNASQVIRQTIADTLTGVKKEVAQRTYRASNELRNASLCVLRGDRTGKVYRVPHTAQKYTASAPGEPPAVRTGVFRLSWTPHVHVENNGQKYIATAAIESRELAKGFPLGELLENGHGHTAPRPFKQRIIDRALPKIKEIYNRPYKGR